MVAFSDERRGLAQRLRVVEEQPTGRCATGALVALHAALNRKIWPLARRVDTSLATWEQLVLASGRTAKECGERVGELLEQTLLEQLLLDG